MVSSFQDRDNLYLVMDLVNGGDLRFHLNRKRRFTEEQTKFFIACILVSLEYIHSNGIIHRDIKPENLVFDDKGYLHTTDFGIARVWKPENYNETSGTPGYMAPEIMCRQNHGIAVDYFAMGIIAYECMIGQRPYKGKNRKEIRDQILAKQVQIRKTEIPDNWSLEAADFINKLIMRKPCGRLGNNGPEEVKGHPWFNGFMFDELRNQTLCSPFVPNQNEDKYHKVSDLTNEKEKNSDQEKQNALILRRNSIQELFLEYDEENRKQTSTKGNEKTTNKQRPTHRKSYSLS